RRPEEPHGPGLRPRRRRQPYRRPEGRLRLEGLVRQAGRQITPISSWNLGLGTWPAAAPNRAKFQALEDAVRRPAPPQYRSRAQTTILPRPPAAAFMPSGAIATE